MKTKEEISVAAKEFALQMRTKPGTESYLNAIEWFTAGFEYASQFKSQDSKEVMKCECDVYQALHCYKKCNTNFKHILP